jgi:hypothetical protein
MCSWQLNELGLQSRRPQPQIPDYRRTVSCRWFYGWHLPGTAFHLEDLEGLILHQQPVSRKIQPCQGVRDPLSVLIYRGFLPINLQLTRASKTAIPLRDSYEPLLPHIYNIIGITE